MARYENEGYCPNQWLHFDDTTDKRLIGLWAVVGPNVVYDMSKEDKCPPYTDTTDRVFDTDPVAFRVLKTIAEFGGIVKKVVVHQVHNGAMNIQSLTDVYPIMQDLETPRLIAASSGKFLVVVGTKGETVQVYIWDLNSSYCD